MPFFDNNGIDYEAQSPFWGVFATLRDQLERLIALNIAWSVQLAPALLALGFPELPLWLREALLVYSGAALVPATAALYALVLRAVEGEQLSLEAARETIVAFVWPSLRVLGPLFGALGFLLWAAALVGSVGVSGALAPLMLGLDVTLRLLFLLGLACALYWGQILAASPNLSAADVARRSALLIWRYPANTALVGATALLALILGALSVGGLFLVVPVLIALFQTHVYLAIRGTRRLDGETPWAP